MPLLDASTNKRAKKSMTVFLDENLLTEVNSYCQWRHIKSIKEFAVKSMQYVLKNDKDWRKVCSQIYQTNNETPTSE